MSDDLRRDPPFAPDGEQTPPGFDPPPWDEEVAVPVAPTDLESETLNMAPADAVGPPVDPIAAPSTVEPVGSAHVPPAPTPAVPAEINAPIGDGEGAPKEGGWLPSLRQVGLATRLNLSAAIGPDPEWPVFTHGLHSSMRQALGLIVVVTLIVGLPTLVTTWMGLAERGATLQLLQVQAIAGRVAGLVPARLVPDLALELQKTAELVGGLSPSAPPQVAAGLSATSAWLALPMRALTIWMAYGLLVLGVAKALGSGATLPRFYASTGYAVMPLVLLLLFPLPVVGPWIGLLGVLLALVAYGLAVAHATELDHWRAAIAVLLPAAVLALAGALLGFVAFALFF
ncbi:MAG: hypothetical protein ACRC1H_13160 [Caldilineaceae bacterium]